MPFCKKSYLGSTEYPLYCVKALTERYFLVAGGGGCSKTGVDNSLAIYEITLQDNIISSKLISEINLGLYAPMNMAICYNNILNEHFIALGLGEICQTYILYHNYHMNKNGVQGLEIESNKHIKNCLPNHFQTLEEENLKEHENNLHGKSNERVNGCLIKRNTQKSKTLDRINDIDNPLKDSDLESNSSESFSSHIEDVTEQKNQHNDFFGLNSYKIPNILSEFTLKPLNSIKTDFSHQTTGHQKTVKICTKINIIVTGATDGFIRIWKLPTMNKIREFKAHENEIDEVEINPTYSHIVSLSRDGHAYVWNSNDGQQVCELEWGVALHYRFRACKYSTIEPSNKLFTVHIPCRRSKKREPCYLSKWDLTDSGDKMVAYNCIKTKVTGKEESYILAIDSTSQFLAIGTSDGSVSIYDYNLKVISHFPNAHSIFITGLDFIPLPNNNLNVISKTSYDKGFNPSSQLQTRNDHFLPIKRQIFNRFIKPSYAYNTQACLLSISVDRKINFYRVKSGNSYFENNYYVIATILFFLIFIYNITLEQFSYR